MLLNVLKNYMRHFPLNEGKRVVYNYICKNIRADNEVIMTHDGVRIELDPGDRNQRYIYWYGRYNEKDEIKIIKALLHEGDCFIDVGEQMWGILLLSQP